MTVNFDLWRLTLELDLDMVKMNQHARYLSQRLFIVRKLLSGHTDTQTEPTGLIGTLTW